MNRVQVVSARIVSAAFPLLLAATASAQQASGIAGVVRDTSSGVLPGVTVEASSPALIEKVRTAVTDGQGRYNITDLRPGTYVVTFSLVGFSVIKREGIELTAGFTATVNADLQVGALEETITVTGAAPLVDTQNVRQQKVVSAELLSALPTSTKAVSNLLSLTPGVVSTADVGSSSGIYTSNGVHYTIFHGKGGSKYLYDGMGANNLGATGATSYILNPSTAVESTVETGGQSAESSASGLVINMIPKEGGNAFTGSVSGFYTDRNLQSDNLTDTLRARGLTTTNKALRLFDSNLTLGGPIKRDRLWFFTATRYSRTKLQIPGIFFNTTQGTPFYTPGDPAYRTERLSSQAGRVTWQISAKNKLNVFADPQSFVVRGRGDLASPEAATAYNFWPQGLYQATWNSPRTNKFLLEGGVSLVDGPFPYPSPGDGFMRVSPTDISITEQSTGLVYNARGSYTTHMTNRRMAQRLSGSYITGSHAYKLGVQLEELHYEDDGQPQRDVRYRFLNGAPNQITQSAGPYKTEDRVKPDLGIYAQDQWHLKRLTLNYGLRFDYFKGYVPAQQAPAGQFVPARDFAAVSGVPDWKDVNPRFGASYDLFGNGRTAFKVSLGRYVEVVGTSLTDANNPIRTSVNSVTRTWNDVNKNYMPDCDLTNFALNGECGQIADLNFGKSNPLATRYADDVLRGFGVRNFIWDFATEVQDQIGPGLSITAGYYRNRAHNFRVTDNLAVTPADYSPYCITAPVDARLPGGGGYQVCGLYDVAPAKFGQISNLVTQASNFYDSNSSVNCGAPLTLAASGGTTGIQGGTCGASNFFGVSVSGRLQSGLQFGGGVDTGRSVTDACFVVDSPQQLLNCRVVSSFRANAQLKVFGTYQLPRGVSVSSTLQNVAGPEIEANYTATNAQIAPSLGHNLAACGTRVPCVATATVPLITPQTLYEARRTQVDFRLSKRFTLGPKTRLQANLDIYNLLNASSILGVNSNYGSQWLRPQGSASKEAMMEGRLLQFSGELAF